MGTGTLTSPFVCCVHPVVSLTLPPLPCACSGWLDDIGLPQYKTQFDEGRVDGRMLHYMTVVSLTGL